jgi:hypothetical protein
MAAHENSLKKKKGEVRDDSENRRLISNSLRHPKKTS